MRHTSVSSAHHGTYAHRFGFAAAGLLWLLWQLVLIVRALPSAVRIQYAEPVGRLALRVLSGIGSLAAGIATLVVWSRGTTATSRVVNNFHILDALSDVLLVATLALFVSSFFLFPPLGLVELSTGSTVLVTTEALGRT